MSWRNLSLLLAMICAWQTWRGCHRTLPKQTEPTAAECEHVPERANRPTSERTSTDRSPATSTATDPATATATTPGFSFNGFKVPAWAAWLAPQPGENLLDYRDRIVPIAQAAVAPHRARVARGRDDFAKVANLDAQQRAQLDAAAQEASAAIQDKVMDSLMSGDLMPSQFKPMTGVSLARDMLDTIEQANRKFVATLREDQKAALARHPFDFADYLLFSARWEDALGVTN
jgi:hypothetical protein